MFIFSNTSGTSPTHGAPPAGPRVVLGRETTPTPQHQQQNGPRRIPKEIWDRFEGKSREVNLKFFNFLHVLCRVIFQKSYQIDQPK